MATNQDNCRRDVMMDRSRRYYEVIIRHRPGRSPLIPPSDRQSLARLHFGRGLTALISCRPLGRLDPLGLLRCRRLTLHLPLRILRGCCNVACCAIHPACRRMLSRLGCHTGRLAGSRRRGSGTCVLQVCGSTRAIAGPCHCGAEAQDDRGATREKEMFRIHLLLLCRVRAQRAYLKATGRKPAGSGWPA